MLFLIDSAIKNGWSLAKKNFRFMILIMITILFIQWIFYYFLSLLGRENTKWLPVWIMIIINILSVIIWIFINVWRKNINLQIASKWSAQYSDFWNKMPKLFFKFLLTTILYFIAIAVLFILPSILFFFWSKVIFLMILAGLLWLIAIIFTIIFVIRAQFFPYLIIDKWLYWHKALMKSLEITKWCLRELIWFSMAKFVLIILGAILAFVWLLRAIPACQIATADFYRKITSTTKSSEASKSTIKKPLRKIVKKTK